MGGGAENGGAAVPRVAPLRQLKEACASLRGILKELESAHAAGKIDKAQLKQQRWQAVVLLSAMKAGLRDTFLAGDEWKTRVQEQKDVVETHQLQLQNLLYEKDHLVREIRRCKGFLTTEMDRIEFASGAIPIVVDADVHRQHLDQLTQELETRKRMVTQVKEVKAKIEVVEAATHRKQAFLDGLRSQLDTIEDSTGGLQKYMSKPVSATLRLQHEASAQLVAPLYTLFCELEAYQTASGCRKQMQVSIVDAKGLKSAALRVKKREFPNALTAGGRIRGSDQVESMEPPASKRLKGPSRSPSTGKQRDAGTASKAPSRSPSLGRARPTESGEVIDANGQVEEEGAIVEGSAGTPALIIKEMSEVKLANDDDNEGVFDEEGADTEAKDLWRCAEKAVLLKLSLAIDDEVQGDETKEFAIMFQYFPTAQVVTAEMVSPSNLGKHILTSLFPGDDGLQLANHATEYKFVVDEASAEVTFPFESTTSRPYHWAQWICGLHPLQRQSREAGAQQRPEPSVRNVLQQLIKRLTGTTQLRRHLAAFTKGAAHAPVHPSFSRHFPTEIKTKLSGWKEVAHPKADVLDLFKTNHTGSQFFRVSLKNDKLQVDAVIQIAPDYPLRAPQFRLSHGSATATDNALKEIEIEVNTYYDEIVARNCEQYLLAHQLRKVQHCVDVVSAGTAGNLPTCFGRERRGKDRRPALVVDPVTKEVRHR